MEKNIIQGDKITSKNFVSSTAPKGMEVVEEVNVEICKSPIIVYIGGGRKVGVNKFECSNCHRKNFRSFVGANQHYKSCVKKVNK